VRRACASRAPGTHLFRRDVEAVCDELLRHDINVVEAALEDCRNFKGGAAQHARWRIDEVTALERALRRLQGDGADDDVPRELRAFPWTHAERGFLSARPLVTVKAVVVAVNSELRAFLTDTDCLLRGDSLGRIHAAANRHGIRRADVLPCCAALEERLQCLSERPGEEKISGLGGAGRSPVIALRCYEVANPTHFSSRARLFNALFCAVALERVFTACGREVRCWAVREASTVLDFARGVHDEMARSLMFAETCAATDVAAASSEGAARRQGKVARVGADVILEDGQVVWLTFKLAQGDLAAAAPLQSPRTIEAARLQAMIDAVADELAAAELAAEYGTPEKGGASIPTPPEAPR